MNFIFLVTAIMLNIMANYFMKKIHVGNDTSIFSLIVALTFLALSFACYTLALKNIPISTAYVLLTGCSLVGITIIGVLVFGEPININILLGVFFILVGVITISLGGSEVG